MFCVVSKIHQIYITFQSTVLRQNILSVDIFSENSALGSWMFILCRLKPVD